MGGAVVVVLSRPPPPRPSACVVSSRRPLPPPFCVLPRLAVQDWSLAPVALQGLQAASLSLEVGMGGVGVRGAACVWARVCARARHVRCAHPVDRLMSPSRRPPHACLG